MSRYPIRPLPPLLVQRIAAGEMIERIASVVKELVENSIDAQASSILIELQDGGKKRIVVKDNGVGIAKSDLLLAISSHATSKLTTSEDLENICTLGFRGEALASIAAVSRLSLASRSEDSDSGYALVVENSRPGAIVPYGMSQGTMVVVEALFHEMPARRKTLKAASTETAHCLNVIEQLALACPEIHFKLISDQKQVDFRPSSLQQRVLQVTNLKADDGLWVENEEGGVVLKAFLGKPSPDRQGQPCFIVNKRPARVPVLWNALKQGYGDTLYALRLPPAVIWLDLSPKDLDPNVHPTKSEVRLRFPERIHPILKSTVESAFAKPLCVGKTGEQEETPRNRIGEPVGEYLFQKADSLPFARKETVGEPISLLHDTYLLAASTEGLVIVDIHAAHERILYERMKEGVDGKAVALQKLLLPKALLLPRTFFEEEEHFLNRLGFYFDDKGCLTALPLWLGKFPPEHFLLSFISWHDEHNTMPLMEKSDDHLAHLACKAELRAPISLSLAEMRALLEDLTTTPRSGFCNHGRPVVHHFSSKEIDRWFLRGR